MTPSTHNPQQAKPVIVLGAGGHARVLRSLLSIQHREVLAVLDDNAAIHGKQIDDSGLTVLGGMDQVAQYAPDDVELVNGIGCAKRPTARQAVYEAMTAQGYTFATLRHDQCIIANEAAIDPSAQVLARAVVQACAQVHANAIINTGAIIEHDTTIGQHTHIAPGATICGGVTVGNGCHIGAGATIIPGLTIGEGVIIGAGAVVLANVSPGQTQVGNPARNINS